MAVVRHFEFSKFDICGVRHSSVSSADCVRARPLLKSFHWLPVQQRIQYKIAVITHKKALQLRTPTTTLPSVETVPYSHPIVLL